MRRVMGAGLALVLLLGCGGEPGPEPGGPMVALRLRRDLPALARVRAEDFETIPVPADGLPPGARWVRRPADAIGQATRSRRPRGSLLLVGHLDPRSIAPEPVAARLAEGELGLVVPLEPGAAAIEGSSVAIEGCTTPLRVVALGPPGPSLRAAVLAGDFALVLALARGGPRLPVRPGPASPALPRPTRSQPATRPGTIVHARRAVPAGVVLVPDDLALGAVGPGLAPEDPVTSPAQAVGKTPKAALEPGEFLVAASLASPLPPGAETVLAFDGLHPDWVHPGADALLLRPGAGSDLIPVTILDVLRQAPGQSAGIRLGPAPGARWPKAQPRREGGQNRWMMLLAR